MLFIFFLIGFFLFIYNKNKWKNNVTLLLFLFPFFGLIANNLRLYSNLSAIFYDFILIIPIYLTIITMKLNRGYFGMMNVNLRFAFFFLILLVFAQMLNPYSSIPVLSKLVGLKVWLFYFLLVAVGFYYIETKDQVIKLCKTLSLLAFIPCTIGILQLILSFNIGYQETMGFFYIPEVASGATQNFTKFTIASNIILLRIPSTFSSAAQFSNYLLFSFVPVLTAINFSKSTKEKFVHNLIFFLIIIASVASGIRGMFIYVPIFFIYYFIINSKINKLILYGFLILFIIFAIYNLKFANLNYLFEDIQRLIILYKSTTLENGFNYLLDNFLGNGVGTATFQTHFVTGKSVQVGPNLNESYFFKVMTELGFLGIIAVILLYLSIVRSLLNCLKLENEQGFKVLISSFTAFYLLMVTINLKSIHIDLFPSNILIYLFLGIILKLNQIKDKQFSEV